MKRFVNLAGALLLACAAAAAQAQQYPSKAITIIVPFPPGGIHDWYSREIGNVLTQRWGQPVVIDNKSGGGGWIGIQALARAKPDGHTLFAAGTITAALPAFVKGASLEPGKDVAPITGVLYAPYVIITNTQVPVKTLRELLAYAKTNAGKMNFAYVANTGHQIDTYDFIQRAGLNITTIPYQGGAAALRALLANEVQLYFGAALGLEENVKAGRITPLAVTSARPFARLPEIPTVQASSGIDYDAGVLYPLYASPGTPRSIIDKLHGEIVDIVQNTEVNAKIVKQGYEVRTTTPEELSALLVRDARRAIDIGRAAGIQPQ